MVLGHCKKGSLGEKQAHIPRQMETVAFVAGEGQLLRQLWYICLQVKDTNIVQQLYEWHGLGVGISE